MNQALFWLTLTALMTALLWVPYILNAFAVRGIMGTMANPKADAAPLADWAQRAKCAHTNAIENLAVFGVLILTAHVAQISAAGVATAAMVFFFARAGHFVVYALGIPVLRTLAFLTGTAAQVTVAVLILQGL